MQWFEYLIAIVAVGLVLLPVFLTVRAKKKGKPSPFDSCCSSKCGSCSECCHCGEKKEPPERFKKKA